METNNTQPSVPTVTETGGIYSLLWKPEGIQIRISGLESKHHDVFSRVRLGLLNSADGNHLHMAKLNLMSTQSKNSLAKHMLTEFDLDVPWAGIVEQASSMVLNMHEKGEPIHNLSDVDWATELPYRVHPVLAEQRPNLIYGFGGLGKSMLALYLASLCESAYSTSTFTVEPARCLYLDWEESKEELSKRHSMIMAGLGLTPPADTIKYRFCHLPLAGDVQAIQQAVLDHDIELVIVDSAGPATGGMPEDAGETLKLFNALRSVRTKEGKGVTTLIIAHTAKNAQSSSPFGSVYWSNASRNTWEIKKAQGAGDDSLYIALHHKKTNSSKLFSPIGLKFTFTDESLKVDPAEMKDVPEFHNDLPIKDRVAILLETGAMSIRKLSEELDVPQASIRTVVSRWKDKKFVKVGKDASGEQEWGNMYYDST